MSGLLALLQQVLGVARTQAAALWNVVSAIAANKSAPARQVVIYTIVLIALAYVAPKIIKAVTK